ncbi:MULTISPECIES: hypothetical protein [Myxococcus]|uniref:hypothetical protein n=1 Tax=Myxococcus TaxID=32 RepID=UPI0013D307ED|nr:MULTISPECIES: hypothetical protein [Myxococcus]NVJ24473.1 hypothetical protein [Myxococcus sp. AM011]
MGMLGLGAAVTELLSHLTLESATSAQAAARALGLLSGAQLKQQARMASEEAEVEDGDVEVEQWDQDPEPWHRWWATHQHRFHRGVRWRHGHPFSLGSCLDELKEALAPPETRIRAALELTLQARRPFDFEHDWPVPRQRQRLSAWESARDTSSNQA